MTRLILAAGLILSAGSAFARDIPSSERGVASAARSLGDTASPGIAYGSADPRVWRNVQNTGSIVIRPATPQKVMGLPVPGEY